MPHFHFLPTETNPWDCSKIEFIYHSAGIWLSPLMLFGIWYYKPRETNSFDKSNIKNRTKVNKLTQARSSWFFIVIMLASISHAIRKPHSRTQAPCFNSMDFMRSDLCNVILCIKPLNIHMLLSCIDEYLVESQT